MIGAEENVNENGCETFAFISIFTLANMSQLINFCRAPVFICIWRDWLREAQAPVQFYNNSLPPSYLTNRRTVGILVRNPYQLWKL